MAPWKSFSFATNRIQSKKRILKFRVKVNCSSNFLSTLYKKRLRVRVATVDLLKAIGEPRLRWSIRRVTSGVTSNFHREDEIHPTTLWHFGNSNKLKDRRSRREENFRSPRFPGVSLSLVVFRSKTKVRQRSRANTRTINFTVKRQFQTRCNRDRTRVAVRDFFTFYNLCY